MSTPKDTYRELFDRSADAILIIEDEQFVDCNAAAVKMLRYETREEVLSTHPSELSPPTQPDGRDSFEKANEFMGIAFAQGSHRFEWAHRRADGEIFPVEVLLTAIESDGKPTLHVVWRDITERRHLEQQLRHAQKMEAVGKLAGGVAHDFNNLLVVILGHADLLSDTVRTHDEALGHVGAIQEAGQRAAALVKQLLAFGRKQQRLPAVVDLNELVSKLRTLLERLIGEDLQLVTSLSDEHLFVKVDTGQIEQVIMNLASNARDASPKGGVLRIETGSVEMAPEPTADPGAAQVGRYASLSLSDSGTGMAPETVARAFDPFFTTKEQGRGTGLGLSTVYSIVQQSQGTVSIDSEPGRGTTVTVHLPLTTELPSKQSQPKPRPAPTGGSERILVVEDEEGVRKLIVRTLKSRGYDVVSAKDGQEGGQVFTAAEAGFDIIVTDVIMPRVGGPDMVTRLAAEGHRPPVLFLSGYTDQSLSTLHEIGEDVDFLEKPFSPSVLAARVRRALDRRTEDSERG